ncbi:MAG TPA: hypothetical protein VJB05_00325 [archaeon]|nr:hypothetical protein [archaeon]
MTKVFATESPNWIKVTNFYGEDRVIKTLVDPPLLPYEQLCEAVLRSGAKDVHLDGARYSLQEDKGRLPSQEERIHFKGEVVAIRELAYQKV